MKIFEILEVSEAVQNPEYLLHRHNARQDPVKWRATQQKRYHHEEELMDPDNGVTRHVAKSQMGYKPFGMPLIRFGKFRQQSEVGLTNQIDQSEMYLHDPSSIGTQLTHEAGVSVYRGFKETHGWRVCEPPRERASYSMIDDFAPIDKFKTQLIAYLDHGTSMDIFLIYGHLVSFGKAKEWLSLGSDGEFLLDTKQPYRSQILPPDQVFIGRVNLIDWFNWRYKGYGGIDHLRREKEGEESRI